MRIGWISGAMCCGLLVAGCSEKAPETAPEPFPKPIEFIEESARPPAPPIPAQTVNAAEFECSPGAPPVPNLAEAENGRDRRSNSHGDAYDVVTYVGTGLTVFGFTPSYVERLQGDSGWQGVGAYIEGDRATLVARILAVYPNMQTQTASGDVLAGPGPLHPITIQRTDGASLYVVCAPGM